jgi:hypothetical protein
MHPHQSDRNALMLVIGEPSNGPPTARLEVLLHAEGVRDRLVHETRSDGIGDLARPLMDGRVRSLPHRGYLPVSGPGRSRAAGPL